MADITLIGRATDTVFLLHPLGLLAALVVGSISLTLLFAEQGAAMVIGYGALNQAGLVCFMSLSLATESRSRFPCRPQISGYAVYRQ